MGCKRPMIRYEQINTKKIEIVKAHDGDIQNMLKTQRPNWKAQIIPCGKCIGCRLEYSRQWANRGYLEAKMHEQNYFLTLTYNDENLPKDESLEPNEMSGFIKRLRSRMRSDKIQHNGIRYMGCGEYGEERGRPHYHIILFNCNLPIESFYEPQIKNENTYFRNSIIEKCWTKGYSFISDVTWNNIAYTARYITKKVYGKNAEEEYGNKEPEFFRSSRMPGIGGNYYKENMSKIWDTDSITVRNKNGVITAKPPKYFDRLLEKDDPARLKKIKKERNKRSYETQRVIDEQTSLTREERLLVEERTLSDKTMALLRDMERGRRAGQ